MRGVNQAAVVDTNAPWASPTVAASPILQLQHYLQGQRAHHQQAAGDLAGFKAWLDDNAAHLPDLLTSTEWIDEPEHSPQRLCGKPYYSGLTGVLSSLVRYKPDDAIFLNAAWALLRERVGEPCLKRGVRRSASNTLMRPDWSSHLGTVTTILVCHPFANETVREALAWVDTNTLRRAFKYGFLIGDSEQDTPQNHAQHVCVLEHARDSGRTPRTYRALQKGGGLVDGSRLKKGEGRSELYFDSWGVRSAFAELEMKEKIALSNPSRRNDAAWLLEKWDKGIRHYYTQLVENAESYTADQLVNEDLKAAAKAQLQSHLIERLTYYRSALESNELPQARKIYNELGALLQRVYLDRASETDQQEEEILRLEEKSNPDELITQDHFAAAQSELQVCITGMPEGALKQQAQAVLDQANRMHQSASNQIAAKVELFKKHNRQGRLKCVVEDLAQRTPELLRYLDGRRKELVDEKVLENILDDADNLHVDPAFSPAYAIAAERCGIAERPVYLDEEVERVLNDLREILSAQREACLLNIELTHTLRATVKGLQCPNPAVAAEYLKRHAKRIQGRPSRGWRILGGLLMALGACLCIAGVVIAAVTVVPTLGLGTVAGIKMAVGGAAVSSLGASLFYHHRQKGLSKKVDRLGMSLTPGVAP